MNVNIKEKLYKQIKDYCSINNLPIGEYINDLLQKAFMVDKYGEKPSVLNVLKKSVQTTETVEERQAETTKVTDEKENTEQQPPQVTDIEIELPKQKELKPNVSKVNGAQEEKIEEIVQEVKPKKRKLK